MPASGEAVGNRVRSRLLGEENDYEQCDFRVIDTAWGGEASGYPSVVSTNTFTGETTFTVSRVNLQMGSPVLKVLSM